LNNDDIFSAVGFGGNYIVVDTKHDMVIVARWLESSRAGDLLEMVLAAVEEEEDVS
jgi:hypothetical protein